MLFLIIITILSVLSFYFVVLCPTCARLRGFIDDNCHVLYWLILSVLAEKKMTSCSHLLKKKKVWGSSFSEALSDNVFFCANVYTRGVRWWFFEALK